MCADLQPGRSWPPGEYALDPPVTCTLTRFGFRSRRQLWMTMREHRQMLREIEAARSELGLLQTAFLPDGPRAMVNLSIWEGRPTMSGSVDSHVDAVRRSFSRLAVADGVPELWSTQWRLTTASNNLKWGEFDLGSRLRGVEHV